VRAARLLPLLAVARPRRDPARRTIRLGRSPPRGRGSRTRLSPAPLPPLRPGAAPRVASCSSASCWLLEERTAVGHVVCSQQTSEPPNQADQLSSSRGKLRTSRARKTTVHRTASSLFACTATRNTHTPEPSNGAIGWKGPYRPRPALLRVL